MDVLSEVLRVVRLAGAVHLNVEFTQPWAVVSSPRMLASRLKVTAESITAFHVVVSGRCLISADNLPPIEAEAGDVIIFSRGDQHIVAGDLSAAPVPMSTLYPEPGPSLERISVLTHGGGGEATRLVCGFLRSDQRFNPLLDALPALLCIRSRDDALVLETPTETGLRRQPIAEPHEGDWWRASLRYLVSEAMAPGPGNSAVLARLAEFLFVGVLRWQLRYAAEGRLGWLAGLNDPQVGRALMLLHAEPARAWTVEEIAREAAMSRTTLAKRFVELLGEPPMQYLAAWRMHLAKHHLRDTTLSMTEIAARIGYESEAAFSRAFRRMVGVPPATWRRDLNPAPSSAAA